MASAQPPGEFDPHRQGFPGQPLPGMLRSAPSTPPLGAPPSSRSSNRSPSLFSALLYPPSPQLFDLHHLHPNRSPLAPPGCGPLLPEAFVADLPLPSASHPSHSKGKVLTLAACGWRKLTA
eukprot:GGOE01047991.1.p3 GENE.GGOE01047991.1~~GGOE01047991.1.p3  ORF type:complete len:121 (-),score=8.44 GGOE01047991.1:284-646(-)